LTDIFRIIQEERRNRYIIGYSPSESDPAEKFRQISLRTKDKNLKVYCRSGYHRSAR